MDKTLLEKLIGTEEWKSYEKAIRSEVRVWRVLADQPNLDNEQRLYLYTKAQGLEEALNLIEQWQE